jgi:hypothetical protein
MKKLFMYSIVSIVCLMLSGCIYSSANLARIRSDDTTILGAWGLVRCGQNSAITLYSGRQVCSTKKEDFVGWPTIPTVQEDSNANLNIGKPSKTIPTPKVVTTPESNTGIIDAASKLLTK